MKMEALDPTTAAACFMVDDEDDLLNFSLEDEQTLQQEQEQTSKDLSSSSFSSNPLVTSLLPTHPSECVEEELEWLSNKDAFPAVEFGILSDNPGIVFDHHSPVSVLENSSSTSNSSGNGNANGSAYMSCCASLKVPVNYPVRARSKRRRRRRRSGLTDVPVEHCLSLNQGSFKNTKRQQPLLSLPLPMSSAKSTSIGRRCQHCGVDKTPQWRAGPLGPKTLCNACGVRYKSGRLLPEYRPANSPTFSAALHSNSHRKVIEMRKQKIGVGGMMTHEACGYRSPWLIVDAEESFDVPIMQCPSVCQASLKNNKQQQPLLSLQMSSAKSATSIGRRCQDCGVDETPKWRAGPLGPKALCNACGALYKSVHKTSFKNNSQQQLLLSLLMNSAKSASIKRTCQHCGVDNTPECQAGPLEPKALCDACRVRYKSVNQVSFKNTSQQPLLSLPINSANSGSSGRRCQHCGADKTPQWRAGPLEQTLCNACGVRYRSGRLLPEYRPVNSPTFSAALHSNSHRKVLEMRKQNGVGGGNDDS